MLVISTSELFEKIRNNYKDIILVDTRPFDVYVKGHIPSAINFDLMQFHWNDTSKKGITEFNNQSRRLLRDIGFTKDKNVIFYENISGPSSARGVWLSLYHSHLKVSVLNGGYNKWIKERRPIEKKTNPNKPSKFKGKIDKKILADYKYVLRNYKNNEVTIIDSRTKEEYKGEFVRASREGHIPNAINIDWNQNIDNLSFKQINELKQIYKKISKKNKIITYCQGGYRAANTFLVLKMLGYNNVKMYLGSWSEWGNNKNLPVENSI